MTHKEVYSNIIDGRYRWYRTFIHYEFESRESWRQWRRGWRGRGEFSLYICHLPVQVLYLFSTFLYSTSYLTIFLSFSEFFLLFLLYFVSLSPTLCHFVSFCLVFHHLTGELVTGLELDYLTGFVKWISWVDCLSSSNPLRALNPKDSRYNTL